MSRPLKGVAFSVGFSLYKNDGTVIVNPGTLTKKISKDFGDYADIGTVSEEDTTYGQLKAALTTDEMNADVVSLYIKDDTSGCVPFVCTIYPAAAQVSVLTAANVNSECDTAISDAALATAAALATVDGIVDSILVDTGTTLPATLDTIDGHVSDTYDDVGDVRAVVDAIFVDTGTTLDTLVKDLPTNAELATALAGADDAVLAAVAAVKLKTDTIGSGALIAVAPVLPAGDVNIVQGDDYYAADGRSLDWSGTNWPDLTGATVTWLCDSQAVACTVLTPGATTQTVRLELTAAQAAALGAQNYVFDIEAVLDSGHTITLVRSTAFVATSGPGA